ncbi:hypothetical protein [Mangrovicoccus algicola]|uniref:Sulfotransferase domain-containing protein n=1 Tax=Mangrovicoccus algicola TaxID=2771008 RepID=A0A8J7CZ42_9RHOB|nr:hypothetical protein [Mangrovicoccus algicola]MBE3637348.1 hypothetical protein [Mangrovicoccus algicola]
MKSFTAWSETGKSRARQVRSYLLRRTPLGGPTGKLDTLILHIGSPKTATSTFQDWLGENRWTLRRDGVDLRIPSDIRGKSYIASAMEYINGKEQDIDTSGFSRLFESVSTRNLLVSEESLTNTFIPGPKRNRNGFDSIDRLIKFIEALETPNKKILLTVRRQDKFLASSYAHRLQRSGETAAFSGWTRAKVDFRKLSWLRVVDKLESAFGEENVSVVPFEMIQTTNFRAYYERSLSSLNISTQNHTEPTDPIKNPSLTEVSEEIARIINRLPTKDVAQKSKRTGVIERINNFTYAIGDRTSRPDNGEVAQACQAYYQSENIELAKRKFPDLKTSFTFEKLSR